MTWRTCALPSVRKEHVGAFLQSQYPGRTFCHVVPSTALRFQLHTEGAAGVCERAVHVMDLIDLFVDSHLRVQAPYPVLMPEEAGQEYEDRVREWGQAKSRRDYKRQIERQGVLRTWIGQCVHDAAQKNSLFRASRDLATLSSTLAVDGVRLDNLRPDEGVAQTVKTMLEQVPDEAASAYTSRLWIDLAEFAEGATEGAVDTRAQLQAALVAAFGGVGAGGRRLVTVQGFHFFTPAQWALFQLLRRLPDVEVVAIVHDDGTSRRFETWRRHFSDGFDLPAAEPFVVYHDEGGQLGVAAADAMPGGAEQIAADPRALLLEAALTGKHVGMDPGEDRPVRLQWYADDGVMLGAMMADETKATFYAPDAAEVSATYKRYDPNLEEGDTYSDLSRTAIGVFLLRLHECVRALPDGAHEVAVTRERLRDILSAECFVGHASAAATFRRAWAFFEGCKTVESWADRCQCFVQVAGEAKGISWPADVEPALRLVAWLDHPSDDGSASQQAKHFGQVVGQILKLLKAIADAQLGQHVTRLQAVLRHADRDVAGHVQEVEAALGAHLEQAAGDAEVVRAADVVDAVRLLLGGTAGLGGDRADPPRDKVKGLPSLAVLGREPSVEPVHVLHLADHLFPGKKAVMPWPFRLEHRTDQQAVSFKMLSMRPDLAAWGDLYLLSLALEGTLLGPDGKWPEVVLSYSKRAGGEEASPAGPIVLLERVRKKTPDKWSSVRQVAGGLEMDEAPRRALGGNVVQPVPLGQAKAAVGAAQGVWRWRKAAGLYCPRRFALQWMAGASPAFLSEHTQRMLMGNMVGWLWHGNVRNEISARAFAHSAWPFMTDAEKRSSLDKAALLRSPIERRPSRSWILTLKGQKYEYEDGVRVPAWDPASRAYRASLTGAEWQDVRQAADDLVQAPVPGFLPHPNQETTSELCSHCPVKPRCMRFRSQFEG